MRISKVLKIAVSSATAISATVWVNAQLDYGRREDELHAFWNSNFEPSVKWDFDWDKYGQESTFS